MRLYRHILMLCLLLGAVAARGEECRVPDRILTSGPYTIRVQRRATRPRAAEWSASAGTAAPS